MREKRKKTLLSPSASGDASTSEDEPAKVPRTGTTEAPMKDDPAAATAAETRFLPVIRREKDRWTAISLLNREGVQYTKVNDEPQNQVKDDGLLKIKWKDKKNSRKRRSATATKCHGQSRCTARPECVK